MSYRELKIECCYTCEHYNDWIDGEDCKKEIVSYPEPIGICDEYEERK